jgi:amino acid adenylation domain-containing protein
MVPGDRIEARSNLTRAQFLIWTGQKLAPGSLMYSMAWRFDLAAAIAPDLFRRAFESLAPRIDALRLVVEELDGVPRQRALPGPAGSLAVAMVEDPGAWIAARLRRPFDIARETFDAALLRGPQGWTFFLNQHHLATDAVSGAIILGELDAAYRALAEGRAPEGAPLPSFLDLARAEREVPDAEARAWWAARNAAAAPPPRLYGRPAAGTGPRAQRVAVPLGTERAAALLALAKRGGFEALMPLQARLNILLTVQAAWIARVAERPEAAIGVMTNGRRTAAARHAAGPFVELFPLALRLAEGETFRSLHAKAAETAFDLLRHAAPGVSSGPGQARFNAVLNLIPAVFGDFAGAPMGAEWLHAGENDPQHAVRLSLSDLSGEGTPSMSLDLNRTVFDEAVARRAPGHLLRLLDAMLTDPDREIAAVPLAAADEASARLTAPLSEAPPPPDVVAAFRTRAAEAPEALAVRDGAGELTRAALEARSHAVAAALAGLAPGALIGVHMRRSRDLVAALLGVLEAGCAYVPLDPEQPPARLERIAAQAGLACVLTHGDLAPPTAARILRMEALRDAGGGAPAPAPSTDGPAYVIYTSGSTGAPKGVQVGRRALSRYAHWAAEAFAGRPAAWALHSAIGFDLTVTSIFAPLVSGGAILAYGEDQAPGLAVLRVFEEDAAEVVKLTPAHLSLALAAGRPARRLRTLVLGGENLTVALARRARAVLGDRVEIINEYGPTEAVVGCMIHRFDPQADGERASVPIGRPVANTSVYVLDEGGAPVPDGAIGELCIAGPDRLADGYRDAPEATAAAFPSDPFRPGRRMYRSGDLASVEPDGTVLYHGRRDAQLKLRGVRVEPAEIAALALERPGVDACTVGLEPREPGTCQRCGLDAAHPDAKLDAAEVCALCRSYDAVRERAAAYFGDFEDLRSIVARGAARRRGAYDCVMLLSGGKDSTYALCRLAELTPRILGATLDNGFLSEGAKENIREVCARLGIEHRFLSTPAMNEIFADSLERHANVCNGCFKTIYTLGLRLAREVGAPLMVTGLSRGQLFETRLAPELFAGGRLDAAAIDRGVLEARKVYHRVPTRPRCGSTATSSTATRSSRKSRSSISTAGATCPSPSSTAISTPMPPGRGRRIPGGPPTA